MDYESSASPSPSLKTKIRSSACFSCCFGSSAASAAAADEPPAPLLRSSSTWLRSKAHNLPEIRDRCRILISRIGKRHRRNQSADFRYDPLSYALNFDGGNDGEFAAGEKDPYRNFSARLPVSPTASKLGFISV